MTDPMTLLEEHRPPVPPALPAERAAARAILEAAILAERPAPGPQGPHRSRRLAAVAGIVATAAAVATGTILWKSPLRPE